MQLRSPTPNPQSEIQGQEDSDDDGAGDACDECPDDPNKTKPGNCGCGNPETLGCGKPSKPELLGVYFRILHDAVNAGESYDPFIECEIRNSGTSPSGVFHVNWYLSKDSTITTSDYPLGPGAGFVSIPARGSTGKVPKALTLPPPGDPFWNGDGTYHIGMILDTNNTVDESNETNNSNRGNGLDRDSVYVVMNPCVPPAAGVEPVRIDHISWQDEPGESHGSPTAPNSGDFGSFNIHLRNTGGWTIPDQGCSVQVRNLSLSSNTYEGYMDYPAIGPAQVKGAVTPWHLTGDRIPRNFTGCVTADVTISVDGYGEQEFIGYPLFEVVAP